MALALAGGLIVVPTIGSCSHAPPPSAPPPSAPPGVSPCPPQQTIPLILAGSARLNPGEKGEALATVVRLYQLKTANKLLGLSFDDLLDHDKEALGEDFLTMQEVTVNPRETANLQVKRNPDAVLLLAVALFRQPAGTAWKATKKLATPSPDYCHHKGEGSAASAPIVLYLDENRLELR